METTFESSSVSSALQRIKNTLNYSLKENYGIEDPEVTEKFLHMHGLDKSRFDFINNFETLIEKGIADESVDTNANKADKSITGFFAETAMPINKLVGYRYLYRKMKDMYGKKEAKRLSGEMYDMSLALADSTNILKLYCFAINASKLVMEGRPFGTLHSGIPHRITSYISTICEVIHQLSNHTAGAIANSTLFFDVAHVMLYREHKTLTDLQDPEYRKYVKNCFQAMVHSLNMLSRNAVESPFTNVSCNDPEKLKYLLGEDNLDWYFQKEDMIDGIPENALKDCGSKNWKDYIIETIIELQDIFMEVMDEGDKLHNNRPIEFPVTTIVFSRVKNDDGTFSFGCPDYVKHICENHDIVRYNIYTSEGAKCASCCRLINNAELFELGGQVNSFGGTAISLGSHRVCTINLRRISLECESFNDYLNILDSRMRDTAKILIAHRSLMKDLVDKGTQPFIENGWLDLDKTFSTFGIMGYYEADQDLKKRFGNDTYMEKIIKFINEKSFELTKETGNIFNVEQIPGESMAPRLAKCDRWIYGEEKVPETLYANQFVPLWEDVTLKEKFEREGYLGSLLTGGGIVHFNLGEKITSKQAYSIIEGALNAGCEHFALNSVYSACPNDHFILGKVQTCPVCNEPIDNFLTRTVGFWTFTKNWSTEKREGDFQKRNYRKTGY